MTATIVTTVSNCESTVTTPSEGPQTTTAGTAGTPGLQPGSNSNPDTRTAGGMRLSRKRGLLRLPNHIENDEGSDSEEESTKAKAMRWIKNVLRLGSKEKTARRRVFVERDPEIHMRKGDHPPATGESLWAVFEKEYRSREQLLHAQISSEAQSRATTPQPDEAEEERGEASEQREDEEGKDIRLHGGEETSSLLCHLPLSVASAHNSS